ncbi:hypothetical protein D7X55_32345 [Corallococcus sp. AB049A]|uniref:beta-propeller fold lactonase family protein n=1 Tax=Corallococcus sp. AB049A TaxID=2316721 RepID=UPI000EC95DA3|nr:beta-propeller fold lactonase family protein [Corallococcus sp. AB049A]RKI52474.1 hypothetical protein D7X55_32345 [Corallococcus sp. AB049A]
MASALRPFRVLALALFAATACDSRGCARKTGPLVYVSNEGSDDLSVIDAEANRVIATIPVGKRPRGLRLSADGQRLYVAVSGSMRAPPGTDEDTLPPPDRTADGIALVDTKTHQVLRVLESGDDPESFDVSPDGQRLYVSNEDAAKASVVDVATGKVTHAVPVGGEPEGVTLRPDGRFAWVTSEEDHHVYVIDTGTQAVVARIPAGGRPRAVAFTPDGAWAFVTAEQGRTVTRVDAKTHQAKGTLSFPEAGAKPMGAVVSPDGRTLYVTTGRGKAVAIIDVAAWKLLRTVEDVGERPWGVGITPDGQRLFTANGPSNDVSVIDPATGQVLKRIPVGTLPWGIAVSR